MLDIKEDFGLLIYVAFCVKMHNISDLGGGVNAGSQQTTFVPRG